jgi:hypothetical protein
MAVLLEADQPLDAQQIKCLVAERLDEPVKLHSVITCVAKGASRPASPIVRVRTGLYAHASIMRPPNPPCQDQQIA